MAKAKTIRRLGLSPLARLWRGARGGEVRLCDRHGCDEPGDRPAPKSPNSPDRWYFCEAHAAEYNKQLELFRGPERRRRGRARGGRAARRQCGFRQSAHMAGAAPATAAAAATRCARSTRSSSKRRRLRGGEGRASAARQGEPSRRQAGRQEAAKRFQAVQAAYEVLRKAERSGDAGKRRGAGLARLGVYWTACMMPGERGSRASWPINIGSRSGPSGARVPRYSCTSDSDGAGAIVRGASAGRGHRTRMRSVASRIPSPRRLRRMLRGRP